MIAFAAVAVLVVVVFGVAISRFNASRAERRSLDTYERTLDLLGDVARRSDAVAEVHTPTKDELARPHVRPATAMKGRAAGGGAVRIVPPARARLEPPALPGRPAGALPVFGDPDLLHDASSTAGAAPLAASEVAGDPAGERPELAGPGPGAADERQGEERAPARSEGVPVFDFDDLGPERGDEPALRGGRRGRLHVAGQRAGGAVGDRRVRRATARAAAAVAVVAVGVGGWQIESHNSPPAAAPPQVTTTTTVPARVATPAATGPRARATTPAGRTSELRPTSTSSTLVTYAAPAGPYTITFAAVGGTCWLGAQQQVATSAYLQMWTLSSGERASYHADGPLVVKIGAPRYVTISVDGVPVVLPPGNVQPYDVSFTAGSGTPA